LTLIGTISAGADGVAVVIETNSSEIVRLRRGEAYRGWILSAVRSREATFEKGSAVQTFTLPTPDQTQIEVPPPEESAKPTYN
jgi:hypothetical protein